ncbi:hypothetical protein M0R45_019497 [Rubus argutus]|uniref:Cystatin domain-containing protein n=1 Tax=Rubus argutus TaxID=59490 RepID=A0AAW1X5H7_RUBAR
MSCSMILDPQPRPVKVPLDDPEIVTAAREAIEDFNEDMGTHLRLVRVLEANEWFSPIRSRHYYYLTLEAADAGVVRVYKTEVVEGLQSMIPQSFHHVGDYKSVEA